MKKTILTTITVFTLYSNPTLAFGNHSEQPSDNKELFDLSNKDNSEQSSKAAKLAKELANPNTPLAKLDFKFQYSGGFKGGGNQFTTIFQPAMPMPLSNGDIFFVRPAISYTTFDTGFSKESGMGDISFDVAYAPKLSNGNLVAFGLFTTLPTGSDGLSSERFSIGPELIIGNINKERVIAAFPSHQWSVGNSKVNDINKTNLQLI